MVTKIEVFGTGCARCHQLIQNVKKALEGLGTKAEVIKVEDFETLIRRGITATPGLAIDGEIVSLGRVPDVEEIIEMIAQPSINKADRPSDTINVINPACGCSTKGTMLYPCSGGSNVGQISNEVARRLVDLGLGKFSCLAGVGAHGEGFINAAKGSKMIVAIDGCHTRCATKTLEHAGIGPVSSFVVTELGIKKDTSILVAEPENVDRMVDRVMKALKGSA